MKAVVVGAGAAGTAAALALREGGAEVTVIDGAWGATRACSGAWDVVTVSSRDEDWDASLADRIRRLAAARPAHPYARISEPVETVARVHAAIFEAIGGYRALDPSGKGPRVATDHGVVLRVGSVDEGILDLDEAPDGLVAIATLGGHPTIDGGFVARSLAADGGASDIAFVDVPIEYFGRRSDALVWPHEAAKLGDAEDARARLGAVLQRALPEERAHAWLLPPLLGVDSDGVAAELSRAVGHPVGELAVAGVGPQGSRLCRRLEGARRDAGVDERRGRAVSVGDGGVRLADGERLSADAVILASGSALAGGLTTRGDELQEPLTRSAVSLGNWGSLASAARAFEAGVRYGTDFRLRDADETPHDDVFVCGSLLEGSSHADRTGLGAAVTTGWLAAEAALAG